MFSDSENVKQISEKKLLTKINENSSLERILEYELVELSEDKNIKNYSETSVKTSLREGSIKNEFNSESYLCYVTLLFTWYLYLPIIKIEKSVEFSTIGLFYILTASLSKIHHN